LILDIIQLNGCKLSSKSPMGDHTSYLIE